MPAEDIEHFHRGVCPCCGTDTACTRGTVREGPTQIARYFIKWTVGTPSHGMVWLLSLPEVVGGRAVAVSLRYSFEQNSFMVRHHDDEPWTSDELAGFGDLLDRDDVIDTPIADRVFAVVDDVWLSDPYLQDFVALAGGQQEQTEKVRPDIFEFI